MKKIYGRLAAVILSAALCCTLAAAGMTGCADTGTVNNSDKLSIVCTIFPEYDWTRQILGSHTDEVDLTWLIDSGADLHSFQPTADDIVKISTCDLFIYVGGESDSWVDDALGGAVNKDMKVIELMEVLGDSAVKEELKEGMESEEEEEEEPVYDEHVWLSLRNAETLCSAITNTLCQLDGANADDYRSSLDSYTAQLHAMDGRFSSLLGSADPAHKTLIFGDRFPFRYFTEDYGLDYYAAFTGCSAETEASFETIAFLAGKTDELSADTIYAIEGSDHSIAEAVINSTQSKSQSIAELNSIQSVSKQQADSGSTYLSLMEDNYKVLKEVLS